MKPSKVQLRILAEIKRRGELYWDGINCRYCFTGNPFRVNSRTVDTLYNLGFVSETRNSNGDYATVITPEGRSALEEGERG